MNMLETLEARQKLHEAVIKSLAHLPRNYAMSIILSWISIDDLQNALPTITGNKKDQ